VFAQDLRYRVGIKVLRLLEQPVGFIGVSRRLLVQASFGEPACLRRFRQVSRTIAPRLQISHLNPPRRAVRP
jgi:hypothetical protein